MYNQNMYGEDKARVYNPGVRQGVAQPVKPVVPQYGAAPSPVAKPTYNTYNPAWTSTLPQANAGAQAQPYLGQTYNPQAQVGLSPEENQRIYNQARINFTGAMRQGTEEMSGLMGNRGFVPGQSGIADAAIGKVYAGGLRDLGGVMQGIATDEAKNRFSQAFQLDQMRDVNNRWAQEFGANREDAASNDLMRLLEFYQGNQATVYAPYWNSLGTGINAAQ